MRKSGKRNESRKRQLARRFLVFSLVVWGIISMSVLAYYWNPDQYVFHDGDWDEMHFVPEYNSSEGDVIFDAHSHTTHSDGLLTPEQNIRWHLATGFNAAIITDHNTLEGALETREIARARYNDSIKIVVGMEWTTNRIHMSLVGMSEQFTGHFSPGNFQGVPDNPSDSQIKGIIDETHSYGGIVIANHYVRSERSLGGALPSREQLLAWGVDYIEIVSKNIYDVVSYEFCQSSGLGIITGTDMHNPTVHSANGWTILNPSEFSEEAIFAELRARNTSIVYDEVGAPYTVSHDTNPSYTVLKPLMGMGSIFVQDITWPVIDWLSFGVFFGYVYGMFGIKEVTSVMKRSIGAKAMMLEN